MQIIAGRFKGRRILHPEMERVRATSQKVREAAFSIMQNKILGAHFLDGFSGTGAIGVEAASRGAETVTFIEPKPKVLVQNLKPFEFEYTVVPVGFDDAVKRLHRQFDIVYMDPPWNKPELFESGLRGISNFGILATHGWVVCEHHRKLTLEYPDVFSIRSVHHYGDIQLTILQ